MGDGMARWVVVGVAVFGASRFWPKPWKTHRKIGGLGPSDLLGSGQEVGPSRPDPGSNSWDQDGRTRTGRNGPHLGTWTGPKRCKTKHMAKLNGTPFGPAGRAQDWTQARVWMAPPETVTNL